MSDDIADRIAAVIIEHRFDGGLFECWCQRDMSDADVITMNRDEHSAHVAQLILEQFVKETRTNIMSSSGMATDIRTGKAIVHSNVMYDRRYVSKWERGEGYLG